MSTVDEKYFNPATGKANWPAISKLSQSNKELALEITKAVQERQRPYLREQREKEEKTTAATASKFTGKNPWVDLPGWKNLTAQGRLVMTGDPEEVAKMRRDAEAINDYIKTYESYAEQRIEGLKQEIAELEDVRSRLKSGHVLIDVGANGNVVIS
ncbi:MAG: hypothetical protein ACTS2F_27605 [Thainema sp.]